MIDRPEFHLTPADRVHKRAVSVNVVLALIVTLVIWVYTVTHALEHGLAWWTAYLAVGSLHTMIHLTTTPFFYLRRNRPAVTSFAFFVRMVLTWLPLQVLAVYQGLREILTWTDDDFRVRRMMSAMEEEQERMDETGESMGVEE